MTYAMGYVYAGFTTGHLTVVGSQSQMISPFLFEMTFLVLLTTLPLLVSQARVSVFQRMCDTDPILSS